MVVTSGSASSWVPVRCCNACNTTWKFGFVKMPVIEAIDGRLPLFSPCVKLGKVPGTAPTTELPGKVPPGLADGFQDSGKGVRAHFGAARAAPAAVTFPGRATSPVRIVESGAGTLSPAAS